MSDFASISERKEEYLGLEVNALRGGVISEEDVKLGDALEDGKNHLALLFYPADFSQGPREEILQLVQKKEQLDKLKCKVFACSTDSVQVHLAWQNTDSSDEAEGLGVVAPFPILGDKTQRLCRSLDVLDEETGLAFHSLILLNPKGDVIFKETADDGSSISIDKIIPLLEKATADRPASELVIEELKEKHEKGERLSFAVEEEVDSVHEAMEMTAADVTDAADHEILVDKEGEKSKDSSRKSSAKSEKEAEISPAPITEEPKPVAEVLANAATLEKDLKEELKGREMGEDALTIARAEERAKKNGTSSSSTTAKPAAKSNKPAAAAASKQQQQKKKKCCVIA